MKPLLVTISIIFFIFILPFVSIAWYPHSQNIQEMVQNKYNVFSVESPIREYTSFNDLREHAREEIFSVQNVHGGFEGSYDYEERIAYQNAIYNMIRAAANNESMDIQYETYIAKRSEWERRVEKFIDNDLFAMYYTF